MPVNIPSIMPVNIQPRRFAFLIGFINTETLKVECAEILSTNRVIHDLFAFQILSTSGTSFAEAYNLIINELADNSSNYKWAIPVLGDTESASLQNRIDELTMEAALR